MTPDDSQTMEYYHVFLPLKPPAPQEDRPGIRRVADLGLRTSDGQDLWLSFLGRQYFVDAIAVSYRIADEQAAAPWVSRIFDHAFAALTITFNEQLDVIHTQAGGHYVAGCPSNDRLPSALPFEITLKEPPQNYGADPTVALQLIAATSEHRSAIGAISEASRVGIPRHYRFLSLMRAMELLLPKRNEQKEWLAKYQEQFAATSKTDRQLFGFVSSLRSRCAHGVGTGSDDPIVSLGMDGAPDMIAAFDALLQAVLDKMSEVAPLKLIPAPKAVLEVRDPSVPPSKAQPPPIVIPRR